jgi:hypothetical protein
LGASAAIAAGVRSADAIASAPISLRLVVRRVVMSDGDGPTI